MKHIRSLILALVLSAGLAPAFAQAPPPVPALPDAERRTSYVISGSTCACAVGFQIYQDSTDIANWVTVYINGVQIPQSGNWTITSPSGSIATLPRPITNAVLTFTTAQTGTVQIVGAQRPRRLSEYAENRGVAARDLNQAINGIEAQLREMWDRQFRTVQAPPGETLSILPPLASRASMGACFNSSGNLAPCVAAAGTFTAGTGISFTGTNPTTISNTAATYSAGSGIVFTGTNPTVISVSPSTSIPVIPSRATAITLDLSAYSVIQTAGYAAAGDGGGATFKNVGATAFLDQGLSTCTVAGGSGYTTGTYRGVYVTTGGSGFNTQVNITVAAGAVTAATPTAQSGYSIAVGQVLVANGGNAQIGGTGSGFTCTVTATTPLKASFTDTAGNHWQYVVDQGAYPNIRQFGAKLDWNGVDATATDDYNAWIAGLQFAAIQTSGIFVDSGGYIGGKLMVPRGSSLICGTGLKSLIVPYGVVVDGAGAYNTQMKMCDTFDAGTHFVELCDPTIQLACFTSSLRNLGLFAQRNVVASNAIVMVHTNATQHEGGLSHVSIWAGRRGCTWFEKGYGGASTVTFEFVECSADGSNTMMQFGNSVASGLNYGTTVFNIRNLILGGPSSGNLQTGPGIVLLGGFYDIVGVHCEAMPSCITVNIPVTGNNDQVRIHNVNHANVSGGTACTGVVILAAANTPGNAIMGMMPPSSCTHIVTNGQPSGLNQDTIIRLDMIFNP